MRVLMVAFAIFSMISSGLSHAQDDPDFTQYYVVSTDGLARQNLDYRLKPFDFGLAGDAIDPYSGLLAFSATDVELPGNSKLEVALRRRAKQATGWLYDTTTVGVRKQRALADWTLDVPYISSTNVLDWVSTQYCTGIGDQREGDGVLAFNGFDLNIPGRGVQKILSGPSGPGNPNPFSPDEWGYAGYPEIAGVTPDHTKISCILDVGPANGGGQGFLVITPDGTRYKMDRVIVTSIGTEVRPCTATGLTVWESRAVATEVTDVHGNWVKYDYSSDGRLTKIHSNDGRQIDRVYPGYEEYI